MTGDATYTAKFNQEIRSYRITWKDDTGKTLDTTTVRYGDEPTHSGFSKDTTKQYIYTFTGWQPAIQNVTGDAIYTASFKQETRSYKITWKDDTGKTIDTTTVKYGKNPSHADLTKASDKQYTYTFVGWQPKIKEVTEDATYTAVFNKKKKTVQAGDIVTFGRYEQDNNTKNGREAIEWIVLDVDKKNKKALLLSRYGLRNKPYNDTYTDVIWEKCTLRKWLNNKFLNSVFTEKEQAAILTTKVDNSASQGYGGWNTKGGNDTKDKIFLLSYVEANRYLGVTYENTNNTKARVAPTAYAIAQGAYTDSYFQTEDGKPAGWWWLRSSGNLQYIAAGVNYGGSLDSNYINRDTYVVRPALWVNLESGFLTEEEREVAEEEARRAEEERKAEEERQRKAEEEAVRKVAEEEAARKAAEEEALRAEEEAARRTAEEEAARRAAEEEAARKVAEEEALRAEEESKPVEIKVGDIVSFGHYEQDNISENGREAIEWIVLDLDEENNKALLLSRYGLRNKPYNTKWTDITWEKCTLRKWLNDEFLNSVFTAKEQAAILTTKVDNSASQGYSSWNTKGGNDTKDKIFLLSYAEANRYLGVTHENTNNTKARVAPTAYAIAQGAWQDLNDKTADGESAGWWWLRSPGFNQILAAGVSTDGSLNSSLVDLGADVVRPALWVNLESGIF